MAKAFQANAFQNNAFQIFESRRSGRGTIVTDQPSSEVVLQLITYAKLEDKKA